MQKIINVELDLEFFTFENDEDLKGYLGEVSLLISGFPSYDKAVTSDKSGFKTHPCSTSAFWTNRDCC